MKIKHYYIISKAVLFAERADLPEHANHTLMNGGETHYIDIDDGTDSILIVGDFRDEWHEQLFIALNTCEPLPHPALQGTQPLDADKHIKKLKDKLKLKQGDTVLDLAKAAGSIHPLMRIGGLR